MSIKREKRITSDATFQSYQVDWNRYRHPGGRLCPALPFLRYWVRIRFYFLEETAGKEEKNIVNTTTNGI